MLSNGTPRIMIVESHADLAQSLVGSLADFPVPPKISVIPDGATALRELENKSVDLIITDVSLQGKMSGLDLCRELKSSPKTDHLPMMLLLTEDLYLERFNALLAGVDLLLHKPVVKEELLAKVEILLDYRFQQAASAH